MNTTACKRLSSLGCVAHTDAPLCSSYYAAIFNAAARKNGVKIGGYIVPRAASDPSGFRRDMKGGLFRKVMTYVGGGAKVVKYFSLGPEYLFP